jgi:hypothetical protein
MNLCPDPGDVADYLSLYHRVFLEVMFVLRSVTGAVYGFLKNHGGVDMNCNSKKPLTPALRKLMETCITLKTTNAKMLAAHLNRSPATIRTEFQRILEIMNVHCRYSALKAVEDETRLYIKETNGDD